MKEEPNPNPTNGQRNVHCKLYDGCLDKAVKNNWEGWHCTECPRRGREDNRPEILLTVGGTVAFYEMQLETGRWKQ